MVRTEVDLIINHINHHINHHFIEHHHIIHHQSIIYNILNLSNFSMRKIHSSISTMIMKEIRWPMEGVGDSLILTLIGEAGLLTLIRGTCFLILSETKEEDIQILMSFLFLFLLLMGVMMFSQLFFGSRKLIICLA